jgi:ChrR-like protein with cupin domain
MLRKVLSGVFFLVAIAAVASAASAIEVRELHKIITADAIKWQPAPPVFPKGAEFAVLSGNPRKAGPYVVRIKLPDGYMIPAHWHSRPEHVTVISGKFNIGMGEKLDKVRTQPLGPGGFFAMPGKMAHYGWVEGETIMDVFSIGPFDMRYIDPQDDPSKAPTADKSKAPTAERSRAPKS